MKKVIHLLLCLALTCGLSGCGKRPNTIDPPPGVAKNAFPRPYPDLKTDPEGTLK